VPVRFSLFLITVKVVTARKEEVGGAEIHEMVNLGPDTGSVATPLRSVSTGRGINDDAQPVVLRAEGVTSIWPCCPILRRFFGFVTESGQGSDAPEMNITSEAEPQIRACFLTIAVISTT
jgi:hypothetical protein